MYPDVPNTSQLDEINLLQAILTATGNTQPLPSLSVLHQNNLLYAIFKQLQANGQGQQQIPTTFKLKSQLGNIFNLSVDEDETNGYGTLIVTRNEQFQNIVITQNIASNETITDFYLRINSEPIDGITSIVGNGSLKTFSRLVPTVAADVVLILNNGLKLFLNGLLPNDAETSTDSFTTYRWFAVTAQTLNFLHTDQ